MGRGKKGETFHKGVAAERIDVEAKACCPPEVVLLQVGEVNPKHKYKAKRLVHSTSS